jgi:hypothetical protein
VTASPASAVDLRGQTHGGPRVSGRAGPSAETSRQNGSGTGSTTAISAAGATISGAIDCTARNRHAKHESSQGPAGHSPSLCGAGNVRGSRRGRAENARPSLPASRLTAKKRPNLVGVSAWSSPSAGTRAQRRCVHHRFITGDGHRNVKTKSGTIDKFWRKIMLPWPALRHLDTVYWSFRDRTSIATHHRALAPK